MDQPISNNNYSNPIRNSSDILCKHDMIDTKFHEYYQVFFLLLYKSGDICPSLTRSIGLNLLLMDPCVQRVAEAPPPLYDDTNEAVAPDSVFLQHLILKHLHVRMRWRRTCMVLKGQTV